MKFSARRPVSQTDVSPVVTLNAVVGGNPDKVIATLSETTDFATISVPATEYSVSAPAGTVLERSTTYAIVFSTTNEYWQLSITDSDDLDAGSHSGWDIGHARKQMESVNFGGRLVYQSAALKIAILGEERVSISEAEGEDLPGRQAQMRGTKGLVAVGEIATGQVFASDRADLLRLETEPYRQYRLQVFFKDEAGGSVPISTGGSAWISFYEPDRDRYAGLSPGDHNRDDSVTILHFLTGPEDEYYIEINDYDMYNGDRSADYPGKYHVELTDVTHVSRLANNLSVTPTGSRMHRTVGQNSWAQEFRTGDHTAGYKIDRIQLFI